MQYVMKYVYEVAYKETNNKLIFRKLTL